jgi:hypothetical protein
MRRDERHGGKEHPDSGSHCSARITADDDVFANAQTLAAGDATARLLTPGYAGSARSLGAVRGRARKHPQQY